LEEKMVNAPDRPLSNPIGHLGTGRNPSVLIGPVGPSVIAAAVGAQALLVMVIAEMMAASHPLGKRGVTPNLVVETPGLQKVRVTLVDPERIAQVDVKRTEKEIGKCVDVTAIESVIESVTVTVTDTEIRRENATESEIVLVNEKKIGSGLDEIGLNPRSIAITTLGRSSVAAKMIFAAQPVTETVRETRGKRRCRPRNHLNPRKTPIL
jgi:hypothetical protein